jgi:sulfoxide reductase heme-binding subunit YedZ
VQLRTGWWALTFLTVTLAITPLRTLTGWNELIRFRRMIGLFAFFYARLHLVNYVVVDQFFDWSAIVEDIVKRPWVTVGFTALVLMLPLAVTSTQKMVRRLGKNWGRLHRLVYIAAALAIMHFMWLVKLDTEEPTRFGIIIVALLVMRLWPVRLPRRARAGKPGAAPVTPAGAAAPRPVSAGPAPR